MAKGAAYNALELIRYAAMTAIVLVIVVTFVGFYVKQKAETRPAQLAVYDRILDYAPGFHAQDATGRSDLLVLDPARFTDPSLDATLGHPDNRFVAGRFVLTDLDAGTTTTRYWNKQWYDIYKPLTAKTGSGAALSSVRHHAVLILAPSGLHKGDLAVELVVPA